MNKLLRKKAYNTTKHPFMHDFKQGTLDTAYNYFGAHLTEENSVAGVRFTVWAPHAKVVSVVGDFNLWKEDQHQMVCIKEYGIWSVFIPGLQEGDIYKFAIKTQEDKLILKSDPFAFYAELRPQTASKIYNISNYKWNDDHWIKHRLQADSYEKPMLIYEMHVGSWKNKGEENFYSFTEITAEIIEHVKEYGFTHVELMGLMEHPYDRSWGYQTTGYFAATSRFGNPNELKYFIDQCHQNNIGIILDWVPVHFCKDAHGLGKFDGTPLYESTDSLRAERPNWGTYNFDFEKPEVQSFLLSSARFWLEVFHIDGFRVDAVSSMIYLNHDNSIGVELKNKYGGDDNLEAIAFIKKMNQMLFQLSPGILMIAEEATAYPLVTYPVHDGGLGFNYKWNMGWVNDVLKYMELGVSERSNHHHLLTFSFFYAFTENFVLPFSHDELVYGKRSLLNKMPGDYWQKFANLRLLYAYYLTHPGKKLLFMGSEFAQFDEWKDQAQLDWFLFEYDTHRTYATYVQQINQLYKECPSLWELDHQQEGFRWIEPNAAHQNIITFIRKSKTKDDFCIIICNFSDVVYHEYRIGVPVAATYNEIFNTDLESFGGSNQYNGAALKAQAIPYHQLPYSIEMTVPPLGVSILKMDPTTKKKSITKRKDDMSRGIKKMGSNVISRGSRN